MVDKVVLNRLGLSDVVDNSGPQPSIGIDIDDRINKMVEAKFSDFLQTFTTFGSMEVSCTISSC